MTVPNWVRSLWLNHLWPIIFAAVGAVAPLIYEAMAGGITIDWPTMAKMAFSAAFAFFLTRFDPRNGTNPATGQAFPYFARKIDPETGKLEAPKDGKTILPPDPTPVETVTKTAKRRNS